jgi:phosphotriesterase-related protein
MSVTGPVPSQNLGVTLPHEHVLVDFIGADSTGYHRWNRETVIRRVLPYLIEAKAAGVETILECTPAYLGRDPKLLTELAWQSGLNLITNTGFYGAVHDKYLPGFVFSASVDSLASIWIDEFKNGIEDSGVRPGFIKISVDSDPQLSEVDEKIVRAAIQTHKETGLTIVSHTGPDEPAMAQLAILAEEGISAAAFVWTHAQNGSSEGHVQAARKGAWISLDNVKGDTAAVRIYVDRIENLRGNGLLNRVLISHDAGWFSAGEENGGDFRGYIDIFTDLIPALRRSGFSDQEVRQLLVENPKEAFTLRVRQAS